MSRKWTPERVGTAIRREAAAGGWDIGPDDMFFRDGRITCLRFYTERPHKVLERRRDVSKGKWFYLREVLEFDTACHFELYVQYSARGWDLDFPMSFGEKYGVTPMVFDAENYDRNSFELKGGILQGAVGCEVLAPFWNDSDHVAEDVGKVVRQDAWHFLQQARVFVQFMIDSEDIDPKLFNGYY
jgi:hypothetical protein